MMTTDVKKKEKKMVLKTIISSGFGVFYLSRVKASQISASGKHFGAAREPKTSNVTHRVHFGFNMCLQKRPLA